MSRPTVDLLIEDLDQDDLMDIMNVIYRNKLKYSISPYKEMPEDNDFRFQKVIEYIIRNNTVLNKSMKSLIDIYEEHIEFYQQDETLLEKGKEIKYIK